MENIYFRVVTMSFGKWLRASRKAKGLTQDQLASKVSALGTNATAGYISNLEREYYKNQFNEPSRPNERLVEAIAKVLDVPVDKAREAAGYAPTKLSTPPQTIEQLVEALERLGIEAPILFGGYPADEESFREVVERIWLDIQMVVTRHQRGQKRPQFIELDITDVDIENEQIEEMPLVKRVKS